MAEEAKGLSPPRPPSLRGVLSRPLQVNCERLDRGGQIFRRRIEARICENIVYMWTGGTWHIARDTCWINFSGHRCELGGPRSTFVNRLLFVVATSKTSLDRVVMPFVVSDLGRASLALLGTLGLSAAGISVGAC